MKSKKQMTGNLHQMAKNVADAYKTGHMGEAKRYLETMAHYSVDVFRCLGKIKDTR